MSIDRTAELTFDSVTEECVDTLLHEHVVIMKAVVPLDAKEGVAAAYHADRRRMIHRRLAARAVSAFGFDEESGLYRRVQAPDVSASLEDLPRHMRSILPAVEPMQALNQEFGQYERIKRRYDELKLNLALLGLSWSDEAFPEHQDSRGTTGLSYAAQFTRTGWSIHHFVPEPPAPVAYTFETEPGDVVVQTEREGLPPSTVGYREGGRRFYANASLIHSGIRLDDSWRYTLALFQEDRPESL